MRGETPQFKRCCFCVPLRRGLLGWGYAKLVLNLLTVAYIIALCSIFFKRSMYIRVSDIVILAVIGIFVLADVTFNVLFIVAGHLKSIRLLKVSYIYNLVALGLFLLGHCFKIYMHLQYMFVMWNYVGFRFYHIFDVVVSLGLAFGVIFVQVYFVLLVRSEMIKLRNQKLEIQFSNHLVSGEPQCTVHQKSSEIGMPKKDNFEQDCSSVQADATITVIGSDAEGQRR